MDVFRASSFLCSREVRGGVDSQTFCIFVVVSAMDFLCLKHREAGSLPFLQTLSKLGTGIQGFLIQVSAAVPMQPYGLKPPMFLLCLSEGLIQVVPCICDSTNYFSVLHKGLEHLWILVSEGVPGTTHP